MEKVKIIECPRDAMQGISTFIPTEDKIRYLNTLLKIGFDTLDFGSFVSPKAVPQLKDTVEVLNGLETADTKTKLLAIIANLRGAKEAAPFKQIHYLGFPLSISQTFQQRNTNKSIGDALSELKEIQHVCKQTGKTLIVYLSMAFGNPYGDEYSLELIEKLVRELIGLKVKTISIADTVGVAQPENVYMLFKILTGKFPAVEFGVHLHSSPATSREKIDAAYRAGCRRFDGAIRGYGGCPFAEDELVGNIATEVLISYMETQTLKLDIDKIKFGEAYAMAGDVFPG